MLEPHNYINKRQDSDSAIIYKHCITFLRLFYDYFKINEIFAGICGGSASGKTTVAQKIIESLDVPWVTLLSMDCFYKVRFPGIIMF